MSKLGERFREFLFPDGKKNNTGSAETAAAKTADARSGQNTGSVTVPTGRNSVREGSYFAGAARTKHPHGFTDKQVKLWSLVMLGLVIVDLAAFGFLAGKLLFGLTEKLCYAFGLDGVSYVSHSFLQVELLIAYAVDFILGGFLVWAVMNLAGAISEGAFLKLRRKHILILTACCMGVFLILTVISMAIGHRYDSYLTYRFMAPLMCYAGGTVFLGLSSLRFDIK